MNTLHMDHVGPLPLTKKSYQYLLLTVDGFTKFVWLYATKTLGSSEFLAKLQNLQ